ncbi:MAG: hypothetical protein WCK77_23285 [Verrucomicrobiota bacterium]
MRNLGEIDGVDGVGRQHTSDFLGAIMGDPGAAARARHRIDEFLIETPADETAMPLLRFAAEQADGLPWPAGLEAALDRFFPEQFWEHVNPQLPDPLPPPNSSAQQESAPRRSSE